MSETPTSPQLKSRSNRTNTIVGLVIVFAIVGATWWLGESNGWAGIGTGGANAQLLPKVGEEAPEFFTLREDGQPMQLSQFRGQPVWLNFWGSWCAPCRAEMPEFMSAYDILTPQGVVILAVSMRETPDQAIRYRDLVGGSFSVYIDPSYISLLIDAETYPERAATFDSMRSDWQIFNFPTHVFIDADGIVREIVLAQMTEEEMLESSLALLEPANSSRLPSAIVNRYE